jgi:hypothetical protein
MPTNWQEANDWLAGSAEAPLVVTCPRCSRRGVVAADALGQGQYVIDWSDEEHGWKWRDAGVTADELKSPEFGCGYDRRAGTGFVGGAPLGGIPAAPRAR